MDSDLTWLAGQPFNALVPDTEWTWVLQLGASSVRLECPWRIVAAGGIAVTSADQGQRFGLADAVDSSARAAGILGGRRIDRVEIDQVTGDLRVHFGDGLRFEAWNASSGYEAWTLSGPDGYQVIAQGGGQIAVWKAPEP